MTKVVTRWLTINYASVLLKTLHLIDMFARTIKDSLLILSFIFILCLTTCVGNSR